LTIARITPAIHRLYIARRKTVLLWSPRAGSMKKAAINKGGEIIIKSEATR
jgi:hypothetical protein